jgi:hypothetical protein
MGICPVIDKELGPRSVLKGVVRPILLAVLIREFALLDFGAHSRHVPPTPCLR